jgi:hypothetical protein
MWLVCIDYGPCCPLVIHDALTALLQLAAQQEISSFFLYLICLWPVVHPYYRCRNRRPLVVLIVLPPGLITLSSLSSPLPLLLSPFNHHQLVSWSFFRCRCRPLPILIIINHHRQFSSSPSLSLSHYCCSFFFSHHCRLLWSFLFVTPIITLFYNF